MGFNLNMQQGPVFFLWPPADRIVSNYKDSITYKSEYYKRKKSIS
jgi:hypothetical protein